MRISSEGIEGLVAAALTPMRVDGALDLAPVPAVVDHLHAAGASGLYVCGSTGEGMSLSGEERRALAEAHVQVAAGRMHVIVQVGHNSLAEARELAAHAQQIGADAVSATAPSYFKVDSVELLVECMAEVAGGAPGLPFYYYHVPVLSGAAIDVPTFLRRGAERIPNLAGVKYTAQDLSEYQACRELDGGRFDVLWGLDEMLLGALAVGCRGAVGSTYNAASPLYLRVMEAFAAGDLEEARRCQSLAIRMIHVLARYPFYAALKAVLGMNGIPCGPCRLPQRSLRAGQAEALRGELDGIGFFDWARAAVTTSR